MTELKPLFVILLLMLSVMRAEAQRTSGSLAVESEDGFSLPQVTQQISRAGADKAKTNLLIRQSHLYWHAKSDNNNLLDSSRLAALAARDLCNKLHFTDGSNEANFMLCRIAVEKDDIAGAQTIASGVHGEERARLLLTISEHLVFSRQLRDQIDRAYPILQSAISTSKASGSATWYYQSLLLLGKYHFIKGEFVKGKSAIMQIIRSCEDNADFAGEAHYWSELGLYTPKNDSTYPDIIHSHAKAVSLYLKAGNQLEAVYSLRDKALARLDANQPDSAERDGLSVLMQLRRLKERYSFQTYLMMADIYLAKGNFPKALHYTLAALTLTGPVSERNKWKAEIELAVIYDELGEPAKALPYHRSGSDYAISANYYEMFFWKYRQIEDQIKTGDARNALKEFWAFTDKYKPLTAGQKEIVAAGYGDLYDALEDHEKAESYYLEMIRQDHVALAEVQRAIGYDNNIHGSEAFRKIGEFYLKRNRYAVARQYLLKALTGPNSTGVEQSSNIEFSLFKADSALGQFESAIRHFERSKIIKDSIFSTINKRQIAELEIQYQTGQREKSFLALRNKSIVQNEELKRGRLQKNLTLAGIAMLLVIAGLTYNGYRNKKRSNFQLRKQQSEINDQNHELQTLISDKDKLLTEKDWLLKEIHHRVKNNLQIIISLLNSQSTYLKNAAALEAIRESQNRVQAISLIHQKLYSHSLTNVAQIMMPAYVADLVGYLTDCFGTSDRGIRIAQNVDNFELDLARAIPLGLIMNEAITNAIKYAFDGRNGEILIAIQHTGPDGLALCISDNGKGLPVDFDLKKTSSMGMEMMKALSQQLGGELMVIYRSGLQVSVEFSLARDSRSGLQNGHPR